MKNHISDKRFEQYGSRAVEARSNLEYVIDDEEKSILIRQVRACAKAIVALSALFEEFMAQGISLMDFFIEFIPYNGVSNIVLFNGDSIELTPTNSAMGRALYGMAYQRVKRPMYPD